MKPLKPGQSLEEFDGQRITHVILGRAVGLGWMSCRYATSEEQAEEFANAMADESDGWMPDTAAMPPSQRRLGYVRIQTVEKFYASRSIGDSVTHAIREHNRACLQPS